MASTSLAMVGTASVARALDGNFRTKLYKAVIANPERQVLREIHKAGFDGIETPRWNVSEKEAALARRIAEEEGVRIHSVMRAWTNVNSTDLTQVKKDVESVKVALRAAAAYGADAVLWVPCRIGGMPMPQPWEFDVEFDEKTGHLLRVVHKDNDRYRDYIAAHNFASDASKRAIEQLIPEAEKTGVVIAVENVWNNLWVSPELFANFIASFHSRWVRAYFDVGNHVKYSPPEKWIYALGSLIKKIHIKDFLLNADGHGGKFVNIRDGSVNWPAVRKALDDIGYNGWATIEGSNQLPLVERSRRLDLIIAGK